MIMEKPQILEKHFIQYQNMYSKEEETASKSGSDIIEEAFAGERKLWCLQGPWWPGVSRFQVALKRVSGPVPHGLTPSECLTCWGLENNETTRGLFYLAENFERLFEGRIIVRNLATKWILSVCGSGSARKAAAGEELTKTDATGEFQHVSLRYVSVEEALPGDMCKKNEKEFSNGTAKLIEEFLSSRPVPEGHRRLFHGTSTQSMNKIVKHKIKQSYFQNVGDFGPGFYCADKVRTAFRFAILTALDSFTAADSEGRQSASLIYFDVPEGDLDELDQAELVGDTWTEFTAQCLQANFEDAYDVEGRRNLELVIGELVHNPHEVELNQKTSETFADNRKQYAFLEKAGNLLLKDPDKMGVILFDVYMPTSED